MNIIYQCPNCKAIIKLRKDDTLSPCIKCGANMCIASFFDEFLIDSNGVLISYNGNSEHVTVPQGVTSIGPNAFRKNEDLVSVIIPSGVTTLEVRAFSSCPRLKTVSLPDSLVNIGNYAFISCSSIETITIPDKVKSLGEACFSDCSSLSSIVLPNGLEVIGKECFSECSALKEIAFPDSVTRIGKTCFEKCYALQNVKLSNSLVEVPWHAFLNCSALLSIEFPVSVKNIGFSAFGGCSSLKSVRFNEGLISIEGFAFSKCSAIEGTIEFPDSLASFDQALFFNTQCLNVDKVIISKGFENKSFPKSIFPNVSELVFKEGVASIPGGAWSNCQKLKKVTLPSSLKVIQSCAFSNCSKLKDINLDVPNLEIIESEAFCDCKSLSKIKFGKKLSYIGPSSFVGCIPTNITIPGNVKDIGEYAFYSSQKLSKIIIEDGCDRICDEAFTYYSDTVGMDREIHLPQSIKTLGVDVFSNNRGTNHIYTQGSALISNYFAKDYYPIKMHIQISDEEYKSAVEEIVAQIKERVQKSLGVLENQINQQRYTKRYYEIQRDELLAERAKYANDIATFTGFFQKVKKANAEANLYGTDQKLKANLTALNAETEKLKNLEEKKATFEGFTEEDFYSDAKKCVALEESFDCGNLRYNRGASSGIFLSDYIEAYNKVTQPKHNPADDWIVIPRIDVTGM